VEPWPIWNTDAPGSVSGYGFGEDEVGRRRFASVLSLAVVGSLVLGACGDDDEDAADTGDTAGSEETTAPVGTEADTGGDTGGDKPNIVLVQNPWTASALNAEIAKLLIETNLGNSVEITSIDENTMFAGLSSGELDAALELWPSGITEDEQAYFDDGTVVEIGELGAVGRIGWYVPDYVLEEFPQLATWEGFQDPEVAKAFATAETGDLGRFLGTDPSYSQYDETIITNLDLPYKVVFSGSEAATVAELDSKVSAGEPIVMYWWAPTAAAGKYNLQKVELPEYTDDCYADEAAIACDYPEDVLVKIASAGLAEKDPAVYAFLQKFQISTEDQLGMLPAAEIDGVPAAEVAAEWIADNEAVWSAWL
jgi:glycine betaine/proline transport system substrate-binding protein